MAARLKIVRIPRTPSSAFDQHREVSDLVRNQVRHAHLEMQNWWKSRGGVAPDQIRTEQQAADYLKMVTHILHPEGTRSVRLPAGRKPKSGVVLGEMKDDSRPVRRPAPKGRRARR